MDSDLLLFVIFPLWPGLKIPYKAPNACLVHAALVGRSTNDACFLGGKSAQGGVWSHSAGRDQSGYSC